MRDSNKDKITTMSLALSVSVLLLTIKFIAYFMTHSNAILTDALESIVNVVAGGFALFSIYYANQPKDENHPYGHGKMEFLSAGFEGGLVFIAGILIVINSIYAFFQPPKIHSLESGVILSAVAGLINFGMGKILINKGKKNDSMLMIANGKHLISDTVSSIGLIVGLAIILLTKLVWLDQVIAIIFGLVILRTGLRLFMQSINSLLDEADYDKLNLLISQLQANRKNEWIDIHNLRVLKYGSHLHVDCHITLPWYMSLEDSHREVSAVENLIKNNLDEEVEFFIHADPCVMPLSCKICPVFECPVRQAAFIKRMDWNMENLLPNKKHTIS